MSNHGHVELSKVESAKSALYRNVAATSSLYNGSTKFENVRTKLAMCGLLSVHS